MKGTTAGKIFKRNPEMIRVVAKKLGTANIAYELYKTYWPEWRNFDTLNLYSNQDQDQQRFVPTQESDLNDKNLNCSSTYCEMCREIVDKIKTNEIII